MPHSIWIIPAEPLYGKIKKIIKDLAREYHSPDFEPHLTLATTPVENIETVFQQTKELATTMNNLSLTLGPISFSTTYYQSVLSELIHGLH